MQRTRPVMAGLIAALALTLVIPSSASSAPQKDLRSERESVRAEQARVAGQIDTTKASVAEIDAALTTIQENLTTQRAALEKAEADLEQAERDVAEAEASIDELTEEIGVLREEMGRRAIQAYVNPPSDELLSSLGSSDFTSATEQQFYVDLRSQDDADLEDQLNGLQVDLEDQRAKALDATERADAARVTQTEKVAAVEAAKADQDRILAAANARLNSQIARSVELAKTDAELSRKIAAEQAELAARLARFQAEKERQAAELKAAQATRPAPAPAPGGGGSNPTPPPPPPPPPPPGGGVSICNASGFQVACSIAGNVNAMVAAARADGVHLSGSAYRSSQRQIELRIAHGCGGALIYARSCRGTPLTAVPGRSQHEVGLAIDFSNCSSRGTACFGWLAGNAARFGFYNLPQEPWHWSTTGN